MSAEDLERALMGFPGVRKVIAPSKTFREVMLARDGQMLLNGSLWDIKSKSVGAGLRRIWLEVCPALREEGPSSGREGKEPRSDSVVASPERRRTT